MAVVTITGRPKSVRNRCVIYMRGGVLVLSIFFLFSVGIYKGFCHNTESDLFLFLSKVYEKGIVRNSTNWRKG